MIAMLFTAIGRPVSHAARMLAAASQLILVRVTSKVVVKHLAGEPTVTADVMFNGLEGR